MRKGVKSLIPALRWLASSRESYVTEMIIRGVATGVLAILTVLMLALAHPSELIRQDAPQVQSALHVPQCFPGRVSIRSLPAVCDPHR